MVPLDFGRDVLKSISPSGAVNFRFMYLEVMLFVTFTVINVNLFDRIAFLTL